MINVLLGPNGAGKSTYLRRKMGIDSGCVDRSAAMVFQEPLLFDMTVAENVALGLKFRRMANREQRVGECLEKFGIAHLRSRRALTLSGGEAQKVALARALAYCPQKLYLDEPTANLDVQSRGAARTELKKIISENNIDSTWVTHDVAEALNVADNLMIMVNHQILQEGEAQTVVQKPATPEIAAFLGIENIFRGRVQDGFFENAKIRFEVAELNQNLAWVVVHPEDIILSTGQAALTSARNCLAGVVKEVLPAGLYYVIKVVAGEEFTVKVTRASRENLGLEVGRTINLIFKATAVHVI